MPLEPVQRKSLSEAVYDQLSGEIIEGRLGPGDALPAERELCRVLGVNRGAVREAIKRLVQAGLVSVRQGDGARVLDYRQHAGLDLLSHLLLRIDGTINLEVARSVIEMRAALGPDVARLCAARVDDEVRDRLADVLARMDADVDDPSALSLHSIEFWQVLVDGSANVAYQLAYNTLRGTYEQIRDVLVDTLAAEVANVDGHRAVCRAVERGKPEQAMRAAQSLLRPGTEGVLELIELLARERSAFEARTQPRGQDD